MILLSFSKTTASVFAPISTRISDEVNLVTTAERISPLLILQKLFYAKPKAPPWLLI